MARLLRCTDFVCIAFVTLAVWSVVVKAKARVFFVGAVEEIWDYAPQGRDLLSFRSSDAGSDMNQESQAPFYLQSGPNRIGKRYRKAMFREFTDGTFSEQKPRDPSLGLLGPLLFGEKGDTMVVVFRNMAMTSGRNFSIHPHGVQYTKENEGALYQDNTRGAQKKDESVAPGQEYTYTWQVSDDSSPTPDDPDCLTWAYHSHVNTARDVNSGLVGILLTCRPGALSTVTTKYARQFAMVVNAFDENQSWYLDYNIATFVTGNPHADTLKEDEDFQGSNLMYGMNGRVFGNLDGLDVCVGTDTLWHVIGFGTEFDLHSLYVGAHSWLFDGHRVDALAVNPVDFKTATLQIQAPGLWRMQCGLNSHVNAGMVALLNATDCARGLPKTTDFSEPVQATRHHYIAIEEVVWNYAPSGENLFKGGDLLRPGSISEQYFRQDSQRVGGQYLKALFREYEDAQFITPKVRGPREEHLGFLGSVLRVEVGDILGVTLLNRASSQPYSITPHGATLLKKWEGALYNDSTTGADRADDFVRPGEKSETFWFIPESMGPGPLDPPCIVRLYTSSSLDLERDSYTGLVGPIVVCLKGALSDDGRQRQMDHEFFLMLSVTDENKSWLSGQNFAGLTVDLNDEDFQESNRMHNINGFMYGNLPGLDMCVGDRVVWHVFSVGSEFDVHTVYFHGQPLTLLDTRRTSTHAIAGYFRTMFMKAENPGQWSASCQTSEHYDGGEQALFNVQQCGLDTDRTIQLTSGVERTYYIQAEEEYWDYAPFGMDKISGKSFLDPDAPAFIFTTSLGPFLGTIYKKVRYHQYTDATFRHRVSRPYEDRYLGILGPVIMAEAFDAVTIVFRNVASRPYSLHAQGFLYDKASEGTIYAGNAGAVQPGETTTYKYTVPIEFAPAVGDPNCINQAYYSAVNMVKDVNSGLIGPLVICKPGTIDKNTGERNDVDRAISMVFKIFDENESWYLENNIERFGTSDSKLDPSFEESNLMHAINGYIYGNNPPIQFPQGSTVDFHLLTVGNELDIHSVHWHGNPVLLFRTGQHTRDVAQLFPSIFETVRMNATFEGTWLLHCHVHDHLDAGMETVYTVTPVKKQNDDSRFQSFLDHFFSHSSRSSRLPYGFPFKSKRHQKA